VKVVSYTTTQKVFFVKTSFNHDTVLHVRKHYIIIFVVVLPGMV
jgi:hypothetical protein